MTDLSLTPGLASPPPRPTQMRILLVAVVLARFKSNRLRPRNRKALLIGVSYRHGVNKKERLYGPVKDIHALKLDLIQRFGFLESEIVVLSDRRAHSARNPTRENMVRALETFVSPQDRNTDYVFAYAGHCIQFQVSPTQEEPDGLAESLVPSDATTSNDENNKAKVIFDYHLKEWLVNRLGYNSRLVAIIDACSSATVLNLEHHRCNRTGSLTSKVRSVGRHCISGPLSSLLAHAPLRRSQCKAEASVGDVSLDTCTGYCTVSKQKKSQVVCISACKDSESAFEDENANKSLIRSILRLWEINLNPTYKELARAARHDARIICHDVRKAYRQHLTKQHVNCPLSWAEIINHNPLTRWIASRDYVKRWTIQISSPYPLNLNKNFVLCGSAAL